MLASISALILAVASSAAFADGCPNFNGTYQLELNPNELTLTVTQQDCKSVEFDYTFTSNGQTIGKTYPLDGQRRQTYEDKDVIVYETAGFTGDELMNVVEDDYKATGKTIKAVAHFQLNASGELINENDSYDENDQIAKKQTQVFKRK
jgi:hypothetical protein